MDFVKQDDDFLRRLQHIELTNNSCKSKDPSRMAASLRNMYAHFMDTPLSDKRSSMVMICESERYLEKYAEVIDQMDGTGLNNYAEAALALCSHHKNESTKWKTHLTGESILRMCELDDDEEADSGDFDIDITIQGLKEKCPSNFPAAGRKQVTGGSTEPRQHPGGASLFPDSNVPPPMNNRVRTSDNHHTSETLGRRGSNPSVFNNSTAVQTFGRHKSDQSPLNSSNTPDNSRSSMGLLRAKAFHFNNSESPDNSTLLGQQQRSNLPYGNSGRSGPAVPSTRPHTAWDSGLAVQREERFFHSESPATNRVMVNAQKVGGPYANFGQKRKCPDQAVEKGNRKYPRNSFSCAEDDEEPYNQGPNENAHTTPFRTAKQQLVIDQQKKNNHGHGGDRSHITGTSYGAVKKSLGTRRGPASKFVPPVLSRDSDENDFPSEVTSRAGAGFKPQGPQTSVPEEVEDERLRGIDPKMIELINNEIMDHGTKITWEDIAGLDFAKKTIKEIVVWPMLRPDIFTGLRGPPKGLLLFGPPGTGKTLIGKCIASQSKSTFFCISASSLTSKWVGEGEKMVRALFAVARVHQPAVVFIDEIDSLLAQRSDTEHESSRRIKTEFLVQLDGAATASEDRILVIGATNRPQEIDEAARRRFVKRLLIPLPEAVARRQIVSNLMSQQHSDLGDNDVQAICDQTDGYSGADMNNLCREAALGPIRSIPLEQIETITSDQVRPITLKDFQDALLQVRASVSSKDLQLYEEWNHTFGSFGH